MKYLALFASLFLCISAFAQEADSSILSQVATDEGTLEPDNILAQVYLIRGAEFFENKNDPDADPIQTVTDAKRGDELYVVVYFTNPQKDGQGIAKVTYSLTMKLPNGQSFDQKDLMGASGGLSDQIQNSWIMAAAHPKIVLSSQYPAGTYTFSVKVQDHMSGKTYDSSIDVDIK